MAQDVDITLRLKGVDKLKKGLEDNKKEADGLGSAVNSLTDKFDDLTGGAVSGFKEAARGVKTFIKGLKLTRAAVIATGIGALVVGVTALVAAFTKTRKGARMLKVAFAAIGAVAEQITARLQALGGFIVNIFSKGPRAAVQGFKDDMDALPDSIGEAIQKSMELEKATQALTDRQRELTVQRAKDRAEIKALNLVAEDVTKTLKEREEAAQAAIEIEKGLMKERQEIAAEELRIAQEKAAMSDSSDEDLDNLAQLEANLLDIQQESLELQTTLNNKLNTIRAEAARKAEEDATRVREAAEAKAKAEADAAAAIQKTEQDIIDALDARDRASLDSESQRLLAVEDFYNTQLDLAIDNAELTKQIEEQRDAELAELQKTFIKERKERADAARKAESDARTEANDQELDDAQKIADAKAQMQSMVLTAGFDLARMFAAADADATKKEQKKAFQNSKKIAVAETLLNTYFAAQQAYSSQFIPGVPDPSAPIRGAIAAAAAVASGLARVAAITRTRFGSAGGGGGGGGGGGDTPTAPSPPQTDVGSLIPTDPTGANGFDTTQEPVRAYVVSQEITDNQALNSELALQSTL